MTNGRLEKAKSHWPFSGVGTWKVTAASVPNASIQLSLAPPFGQESVLKSESSKAAAGELDLSARGRHSLLAEIAKGIVSSSSNKTVQHQTAPDGGFSSQGPRREPRGHSRG